MPHDEPKIADLLANLGILISGGYISNLLTGAQQRFGEEKQAIVEAGLGSSAWRHRDDMGTTASASMGRLSRFTSR